MTEVRRNTRTRTIRRFDYEGYLAYIKSPEWQAIRRRYWVSKLPKQCIGCGKTDVPLELHHKSYKSLGRENLNHLALVCRGCHVKIHDIYKSTAKDLWAASMHVGKKMRRKRRAKEKQA